MKKKLQVPLYFVLKKGRDKPRIYESVMQMCRNEEPINHSKFSKHFAKKDWYRDDEYEIWKVQPYGH